MPLPAGIIWKGSQTQLEEAAGSPLTELADKVTRTRTYKGLYSLCLSSALPKGAVGTGDEAGFVVSKCTVSKERGNIGTLVVVWEAGEDSGQDLPPDEFGCEPVALNPKVERHPRYTSLTAAQRENVKRAFEAGDQASASSNKNALSGLALELFNKLKEGKETYYMAGIKYSWTFCSWGLPTLTLGGFPQTPGGPMAGYLPAGGWLREADAMQFTGTYFKTTCTWIGLPGSFWDSDLYTT